MHDVYIYEGNGQDFGGLGLVGALIPTACTHDETANGSSEITLEHPFDEYGKWSYIQRGRILKCWVPVRETPLLKLDPDATTQTVTRQVYKVSTSGGRLRLRKKASTSAKILANYNSGTEVVKLKEVSGGAWYQVSVIKDGNVGYMSASYLKYVRSYTETVSGGSTTTKLADEAGEANWTVREQLFEIYRVEVGDEGVIANARHISYKLLKNITTYEPSGSVTLQTALNGILGNCMADHDFTAYTDITTTKSGVAWKRVNPIKAMLDEEEGAATKWGAQLVRDNWNLFFLKDAGRQRGMKIEYGKNLVGVTYSEDLSDVATRIIPVGQTKDGTDLLLPEKYIDSEHINDYNDPMLYVLECSDCKVGKNLTTANAYKKMREKAKETLAGGCDLPTVAMTVDFVSLGDSEEYAQYRQMDKLFMFDEIEIVTRRGYADVKSQVVSLSWDCINDRALEIGVGSLDVSLSGSRLTSWQIPSGINGSKLSYGSVGSAQVSADSVSARHMQADSINTDALQAGSVTTEKLAAGSITADKIQAGAIDAETINAITAKINSIVAGSTTTDTLYAALADITTLMVKQINAENIDTNELYAALANVVYLRVSQIDAEHIDADELSAAIADFVSVYAGTGEFDFATIQNLVAKALSLEQASAESVYIKNLAVTSANLLSATLGKLVIKGEDGKYYRVFVGSDGSISAEEATLTEDELAQGETSTGQQIVETQMNVSDLNASNLQASSAVINQILTTALTAEKITAADALIASATIPTLYTTSITAIANNMDLSANQTIQLLLGAKDELQRWFTFSNEQGLVIQKPAYTDAEGVEHPASIWQTITDETGYHIKRTDLPNYVGSFARDRLIVDGVETGEIATRKTANGGWAWVDA